MKIKTLTEFILNEFDNKIILLSEHEIYKNISGTKKSYREDVGNLNTKTQKHTHVYARKKGKGGEVYSVNIDGSGHDGSKGKEIPKIDANFFRKKGYKIPSNNILESIDLNINQNTYEYFRLEN